MTDPQPAPKPSRKLLLALVAALLAAGTFGVLLLLQNIATRKQEARERFVKVVEVDETTVDPEVWGRNWPREYDGYRRTVDVVRTRYGGSEAMPHSKIDPTADDPEGGDWRILFKGYAFGTEFREERGHAYMLIDQRNTERVKQFKQPGACLHCHASVIPAYRKKGIEAGVPADPEHDHEAVMKGFEVVCKMPYAEATQLVEHPVTCLDCHDPKSMNLRVTRPGFFNGIARLAESAEPVPHLPSVERWRKGPRAKAYDPNEVASRQEMRSFVCGQCHVEYYFAGEGKLLTYPWHKGLKVEEIEAYYDEIGFKDWKHGVSEAPTLKAQHPEFETWSQGVHAKSGVACADCHMPYQRQGALKVSDHHVRSPLLQVNRACQVCHHFPEDEMKARAEAIQERTRRLLTRAQKAVLAAIAGIEDAKASGAADAALATARDFHRKSQWRLDFVAAENSLGFHAPQETARILAEAIDLARQGETEALKAKRR